MCSKTLPEVCTLSSQAVLHELAGRGRVAEKEKHGDESNDNPIAAS